MIRILMGSYGSGKTEISINLALKLKSSGKDVSLVDLDVVTPYFRLRDLKEELEVLGIHVVTAEDNLRYSDLPIIPKITDWLSSEEAVIDTGGEEGAKVIGVLRHLLNRKDTQTYFVLNVFRPFCERPEDIIENLEKISALSRMKFDFLINNSNLGDMTTAEVVLEGERIVSEVSRKTGIKVLFTAVPEELLDPPETEYPLFRVRRFVKRKLGIGG
ncbi:hypothetical protein Tpet_1044 [Thermotoga petrophila RKU-1]|uniref:CobQ/CobB/MinD/ParA nucleotide binding domain-containing protein n=1 Tax=Thermotoga petrophila (strain ATCC BAA-488 / DSM 13995 / JCM 10881 / RKU-1) TaxID=390874 RepID=A5ILI8_THEP1|nr:hypothetical protein [Thermotoga petrophila]ABQ47061.1 hypothetical protein Tpet_1044 [Thermotoga petrophila RKU-1]